MHLIQLLLPLYDNEGRSFDGALFENVRHELTERFGGVTAFERSPAVGLWKESPSEVTRDDVIKFEVLSDQVEHEWWKNYRTELERIFRQRDLTMWAIEITKL
jgi:hypothetical protein